MIDIAIGSFFLIAAVVWLLVRHQNRLKRRAYSMQEAIRNRDFQFRLSTRGMLWGDRAMQEALNNMGIELQRQIAASEVESWQRLTRVLTHEIMNATTPIASISQAFLEREDVKGTALEDGIKAIRDTSEGLNAFVQNYRKLTQLQTPQPTEVRLKEMAESVASLYPDIDWQITLDDAAVHCDDGMLRQVLINVVKNAIEAGATRIAIEVPASAASSQALVISNNGSMIPAEMRRDIFTPFFTTKRTGHGIGLSLSRQMMMAQGGDLCLTDNAPAGYNTAFIVNF